MENMGSDTSGGHTAANVHVVIRRLVAGVLVFAFVTFASVLIGATIGTFAGVDPGESATVNSVVNIVTILGAIVLTFVIFGLMHSRLGQTLGKKLFKIEVVQEGDGKLPTLARFWAGAWRATRRGASSPVTSVRAST